MSRNILSVVLLLVMLASASLVAPPSPAAASAVWQRSASVFAPVAKYTATATVSNATPRQNSTVTVTGKLLKDGKPVKGVTMRTSWYYKTTTSTCSGVTVATGKGSCSRKISRATIGYKVVIVVKFTDAKGKLLGQAQTSFTPR